MQHVGLKHLAISVVLAYVTTPYWTSERPDLATASQNRANGCSFKLTQTLGRTINSPLFEGGPTVSFDERTLIFSATRDPVTQQEDLFISQRANRDDPWASPRALGPEINSQTANEFSPRLSTDGHTLYFGSDRTGGFGSSDLYVSTRASSSQSWTRALNLGPTVNTNAFEAFATPSSDGRTLYFERSTAAASPDADIWVTTSKNDYGSWAVPKRLREPINGPKGEFSPSISNDGLSLYFGSMRKGNIGLVDIWVSRRSSVSAPWGQPRNLGPDVNSASSLTLAPFITGNGMALYFMSTRPGGLGQPGCQFINCLDLYVTECKSP